MTLDRERGQCPLCEGLAQPKVATWSFHCVSCDHWFCNAKAELGTEDERFFTQCGAEDDPLEHLEGLRRRNFATVIQALSGLGIANGRILDVGCASGLFLDMAGEQGFTPLGVEPKKRMANTARSRGVDVRIGLFPEALGPNERFRAIVFNDVLEHIGPVAEILAGCMRHLESGGLVIVNLPNAHGLLFKIACILYRLGINRPYERLWQRMFYTPHLHYFSRRSLALLAERQGFRLVCPPIALPTLAVRGLWKRLEADHGLGLGGQLVQFLAALILLPFSALAPDTQVVFLESANG